MRKRYLMIIIITMGLLITTGITSDAHQQEFKFGNTVYKISNSEPHYDHLTKSQIKIDLHQFKKQTLHDINVERGNKLEAPLKPNRKLNHLATIRAHQIAKHFSHYGKKYKPMTTLDARRAGLPHGFQASENIASAGLGNCTVVGDPKIYHNHNGRDMADMSNDAMMNYDSLENNGHRKNILSHDNTLIGIGVVYSKHKHQFFLAEDFGSENPRSSADVKSKQIRLPHRLVSHNAWRRFTQWASQTYHRLVRDANRII